MRKLVYKHTLGYVLLLIMTLTFAQKKYSPTATAASLSLEGRSLTGYTTSFDFAREEVKKGWWKYARNFGNPLNMKTYYKVTIPSETTDGNTDLEVFTQVTSKNGITHFFLGLEKDSYKDQTLILILDFKKEFYIKNYVEQIKSNLEAANKLSSEYRDAVLENEKQELLQKIVSIEQKTEKIKIFIKRLEK